MTARPTKRIKTERAKTEHIRKIPANSITRLLNHGPTVMLTTTDGRVHNACTVAWIMPLDLEPARFLAVVDSGHKTRKNMKRIKECVINIPSASQKKLVMAMGSVSGHTVEKLKGVEVQDSALVTPVRLSGCLAWIECVVETTPMTSSHDVIMLRAVGAWAPAHALTPDGRLNLRTQSTLHHLGGDQFGKLAKIT